MIYLSSIILSTIYVTLMAVLLGRLTAWLETDMAGQDRRPKMIFYKFLVILYLLVFFVLPIAVPIYLIIIEKFQR